MSRTKHQRKKRPPAERATVNTFRAQHGATESAGMAIRFVPMILILKDRKDITQSEYAILDYYRQQAILAEKSPSRDSCDFSVRGGVEGLGPSLAIQSAKREVSRLEGSLGNLRGIARAVCRDDLSLTQWACQQYGAREKVRAGRATEMVPRGQNNGSVHIDFARWDLKFAARRMMG